MTRIVTRHNLARGLTVLAVAFLCTQSAQAVTEVVRKSTKNSVKGAITEMSKTEVTVKPQIGSAVTVPAADIERIRWDGEPPKLNLSRGDEAGGRLQKALEGYAECAGDPKASDENIKMDIEFLTARALAKLALTDETQRDDAITKLEAFKRAWSSSFHYYEAVLFLGRVHMAKSDFANARIAFDELAGASSDDYKVIAQNATAQLLLQEGKIAEAEAAYTQVINNNAKGPAAQANRSEAILGKAACQIHQQKHEDAIKTLDSIVTQSAAANEGVLAAAYVRQGDALQALGRAKEAVLAYLHVTVLFPKETALRAEALYHLSQLWKRVNQPGRADEAQAELESDFPNSEWTKKLASGAGA